MISAVLISTLVLAGLLITQADHETTIPTTPLTRVIHVRSTTLTSEATAISPESGSNTLLVSEGERDEPAEGPAAFDVFDDGSLLIADPLRKRLAVFSSSGEYKRELQIGFAADDVTIRPGGVIQVREASTGEMHFFDQEGKPSSQEGAAQPPSGESKLLTDKSATVALDGGQSKLQVKFEKPGLKLLSIQSLGRDLEGNAYVALEATAGGEAVDVSKYVRKYSGEGKLVAEIGDIPLDYFISPVDELRIRKGTVYQLRSTASEIQINEWDVK